MRNQYGQTDVYGALFDAMMERQDTRPQNQASSPIPPGLSNLIPTGGPASGGSSPAASFDPSSMSSAAPLLYAYLIGQGKVLEGNNPDSALGKGLLGGLGPSFNQLKEDPIGMGLPSALGVPFLAPFFASDKSRRAKPEFGGIWESLGLPG